MYCKKCGNKIDNDCVFCSCCGMPVDVKPKGKESGSMFIVPGDLAPSSSRREATKTDFEGQNAYEPTNSNALPHLAGSLVQPMSRRETVAIEPKVRFENQNAGTFADSVAPPITTARNSMTMFSGREASYIPNEDASPKSDKLSFIKANTRWFLIGGCVVVTAIVTVFLVILFSGSHGAKTPEEAIERYIKAVADLNIREMYASEGINIEEIAKNGLIEQMNELAYPNIENLKDMLKAEMDEEMYYWGKESGDWDDRLQKASTLDEIASLYIDLYEYGYQSASTEEKMRIQKIAKEMREELQQKGLRKLQGTERQKALDHIEDVINSGRNEYVLNTLPYTIEDIKDVYILNDGDLHVVETNDGYYVANTVYSTAYIAW